nr:MAG TPA: hypothetical protein [Bacteriophage sp.]
MYLPYLSQYYLCLLRTDHSFFHILIHYLLHHKIPKSILDALLFAHHHYYSLSILTQ